MDTYGDTRANERMRISVEKQLRRFLREKGCTTAAKRRAAIERAETVQFPKPKRRRQRA